MLRVLEITVLRVLEITVLRSLEITVLRSLEITVLRTLEITVLRTLEITVLRTRRAVFWHLAPDRIVAAVIARAEREPVLEACAASYGQPISGSCFAPGVIEVSWVLGSDREAHVAALAAPFCRIDGGSHAAFPPPDDEAPDGPRPEDHGERLATVRGLRGSGGAWKVRASEGAVAQAAAMFRRARLRLVALDCEPCAIATLADALGTGDAAGARRQHLSAVTVMPDCEAAAEALGEDLAVPVGLALSWFGAGRAR